MSKHRPRTKDQLFNDYKSGWDLVKAAEKSDKVKALRQHGGSHVIVETVSGESRPVPLHDELSTGTRWKLIKWFIKMGIIVAILVMAIAAFSFYA